MEPGGRAKFRRIHLLPDPGKIAGVGEITSLAKFCPTPAGSLGCERILDPRKIAGVGFPSLGQGSGGFGPCPRVSRPRQNRGGLAKICHGTILPDPQGATSQGFPVGDSHRDYPWGFPMGIPQGYSPMGIPHGDIPWEFPIGTPSGDCTWGFPILGIHHGDSPWGFLMGSPHGDSPWGKSHGDPHGDPPGDYPWRLPMGGSSLVQDQFAAIFNFHFPINKSAACDSAPPPPAKD